MRTRWLKGILAALLLMTPAASIADVLTPTTYTATLDVGESVTIKKTLTVDSVTTLPADVFFLFDTTGSMSSAISTATTAATAITSGLDAALGAVRFGVGDYRDFPTYPWGGSSDYPYKEVTALTADATATAAGIGTLYASGGSDGPESGLYALKSAAESLAWSGTAAKFIVWFGDAPSHDPIDTVGYPGPTVAETISALGAEGITVIALDYSYGGGGYFDSDGDVTAVTSATGGSLLAGTTSSGDIVELIVDAVEGAVFKYDTVALDVLGDASGVGITIFPGSITGDFDRAITRTFDFDVKFTGVTPGTYDFAIRGLVDGIAIARELDSITVGGSPVPEPSAMLLFGVGLIAFAGLKRRLKLKK